MASTQALCVTAVFLAACALAAGMDDLSKYPFIVRPPPKNISCYECANNAYNTSFDQDKFMVLNRMCQDDPAKVTLFRKRCTSKNAKGCAKIRTEYSEFSVTQRNKRVIYVLRYCTDELLPKCEKSESSRGPITRCTCDSDFCNAAASRRLDLTLAAVLATGLLTRLL